MLEALLVWQRYATRDLEVGLVTGNGRIEAVGIDVSARTPGRLRATLVRESDVVTAGQVVATMDIEALQAKSSN